MDPLTHTLVGATLADSGLARRSRLAFPTLLIGANLPDLDVLAYVNGSDAALGFRRGWTHGVLAITVLPILLTLAVLAWGRWRPGGEPVRPKVILGLAYLSVLTHPALDWLNNYGVRLLMPFDGTWFYGDAVFIVDPWLWLLFGGTVFLRHSRTMRNRVSWGTLAVVLSFAFYAATRAPAGTRPGMEPRPGLFWVWLAGLALILALRIRRLGSPAMARGALAAALLYILTMVALTAVATRDVRGALAVDGAPAVEDLMVGPVPFDPLSRTVVAEAGGVYRFASYHYLAGERTRLEPGVTPVAGDSAVVRAARGASCVRGFVTWVRFPFAEVDESAGGYDVYLLDARYVRRRGEGFGAARVRLDRELRPRCGG